MKEEKNRRRKETTFQKLISSWGIFMQIPQNSFFISWDWKKRKEKIEEIGKQREGNIIGHHAETSSWPSWELGYHRDHQGRNKDRWIVMTWGWEREKLQNGNETGRIWLEVKKTWHNEENLKERQCSQDSVTSWITWTEIADCCQNTMEPHVRLYAVCTLLIFMFFF